uniref:Uncharacterized protein n=1 Tax=Hucho hucho TaxID=62062 RepID=A0A4W5KFW6_9TELE
SGSSRQPCDLATISGTNSWPLVQTGTAGHSYNGLRWTHRREAGPPPLFSPCCVPYYLRTQVFPHLDALCQARGTCFRPLDTQWVDRGSHHHSDLPDNSISLSSQQLKISLDLITRSSSFLCLLGHRYGPLRPEQDPTPLPAAGPERQALSGVERNLHVAVEGGYPWVLTGRNQKCSLTELQITQAALMGDTRY